MVLHLVRAPIRTDRLGRWAVERGWGPARRGGMTYDEGRALHHLLTETFGVGVLRPFRLFASRARRDASLYAYSPLGANELMETAEASACPSALGVLDPKLIEGRRMPEEWRAGRRLGFDLRIRPVKRLSRGAGDGRKHGTEIDVAQWSLNRAEEGGESKALGRLEASRERLYLEWLTERLGDAATLDVSQSSLAAFRQTIALRGAQAALGPDATLHGTLAVGEPKVFARLLSQGVGRHKAYGYGMLLLRPPSAPAQAKGEG